MESPAPGNIEAGYPIGGWSISTCTATKALEQANVQKGSISQIDDSIRGWDRRLSHGERRIEDADEDQCICRAKVGEAMEIGFDSILRIREHGST